MVLEEPMNIGNEMSNSNCLIEESSIIDTDADFVYKKKQATLEIELIFTLEKAHFFFKVLDEIIQGLASVVATSNSKITRNDVG